jgi:1-acyl-sn-glycerol-3-phosphate acyltransferase
MSNKIVINATLPPLQSGQTQPLRCDYPLSSDDVVTWVKKSWFLFLCRFIPFCGLSLFFRGYGRLEIKGMENIPVGEGVVVAANHLSYYDPPLLAMILPRGCLFMAKHEVLEIPFWKHLIRYYAFPINRQRPGSLAIKTAIRELALGKKVVIFPEGTRNRDADSPAKKGIGMVASLSRAKVVPVFIEGTDRFSRKGSLIPHPAKVRVIFGEAIEFAEGMDYDEVSRFIMARIRSLSSQTAQQRNL